MLQQLIAIARNTFTESIRQPIFVVLLMLGSFGLVINPSLAAYTFDDDTKLLIDLGLSTILLAGLFLAGFTATGVLSSEIEHRTVLTVVSKPVSRVVFVVGKFLGVAAAIGLAYYMLSLILAFTVRHRVMETAADRLDMPAILFGVASLLFALGFAAVANYLYSKVFTSTFVLAWAPGLTLAALLLLVIDSTWQPQSPMTEFAAHDYQLLQVMVGMIVVFMAVLILTAVAITASTRLGQVMTLLVCIGVFLTGLVSNALSVWTRAQLNLPVGISTGEKFQAIFATEQTFGMKLVYALAEVVHLIMPNLQFLWPADAITQGHAMSAGHVGMLGLYSLFYVVVALSLAVALFQTREVG